MERGGEGDQSSDEEEGGVQAAAQNTQQNELEDGEKVAAPAANPLSTPTEAQRERGTLSNGAQENCEEAGVSMSRDLMLKSQAGAFDPENYDKSASPSSLLGTCDPSISSSSSTSCSFSHHDMVLSCSSSSSHSSGLSLSPPLPSTAELSAVLTDTRLTLDVYPGGAGALPLLWGSIPAELRGIQYLRLGSEDRSGLDGALNVLSNLTELRSLAIRGNISKYI